MPRKPNGSRKSDIAEAIPAEELALAVIGSAFARALFAAFTAGEDGKPPPDVHAGWDGLWRLLRPPASASEPPSNGPLSNEGAQS